MCNYLQSLRCKRAKKSTSRLYLKEAAERHSLDFTIPASSTLTKMNFKLWSAISKHAYVYTLFITALNLKRTFNQYLKITMLFERLL